MDFGTHSPRIDHFFSLSLFNTLEKTNVYTFISTLFWGRRTKNHCRLFQFLFCFSISILFEDSLPWFRYAFDVRKAHTHHQTCTIKPVSLYVLYATRMENASNYRPMEKRRKKKNKHIQIGIRFPETLCLHLILGFNLYFRFFFCIFSILFITRFDAATFAFTVIVAASIFRFSMPCIHLYWILRAALTRNKNEQVKQIKEKTKNK